MSPRTIPPDCSSHSFAGWIAAHPGTVWLDRQLDVNPLGWSRSIVTAPPAEELFELADQSWLRRVAGETLACPISPTEAHARLNSESDPFGGRVVAQPPPAVRIESGRGRAAHTELGSPDANAPLWVGVQGYDAHALRDRLLTSGAQSVVAWWARPLAWAEWTSAADLTTHGDSRWAGRLGNHIEPQVSTLSYPMAWSCDVSDDDYAERVSQVLAFIAEGDVYQLNLARRWQAACPIPPATLYTRLRARNPGGFGALVHLPDGQSAASDRLLLSTSPELLLRCDQAQSVSMPIKGTRPRGRTPADDARLLSELVHSEKEHAELTMITDLIRNDLGRLAVRGGVRVVNPRATASFATVHHAYSIIQARMPAGLPPWQQLASMMPGGSITGCPKLRAMHIIHALEHRPRGFYCGSIGWMQGKQAEFNIAIRTAQLHAGVLEVAAGAGIVADSQPRAEAAETHAKIRQFLTVGEPTSVAGSGG